MEKERQSTSESQASASPRLPFRLLSPSSHPGRDEDFDEVTMVWRLGGNAHGRPPLVRGCRALASELSTSERGPGTYRPESLVLHGPSTRQAGLPSWGSLMIQQCGVSVFSLSWHPQPLFTGLWRRLSWLNGREALASCLERPRLP